MHASQYMLPATLALCTILCMRYTIATSAVCTCSLLLGGWHFIAKCTTIGHIKHTISGSCQCRMQTTWLIEGDLGHLFVLWHLPLSSCASIHGHHTVSGSCNAPYRCVCASASLLLGILPNQTCYWVPAHPAAHLTCYYYQMAPFMFVYFMVDTSSRLRG